MTVRTCGDRIGTSYEQIDLYLQQLLSAAPTLSVEQLDRLGLLCASARVVSCSPIRREGVWGPLVAHREARHVVGSVSRTEFAALHDAEVESK